MNIGIVTTWFERGAAYVSRQYKRVLEPRHEVFIFARAGESRAIGDSNWGAERITWSRPMRFGVVTAFDLKQFRRWLIANRIEMVIFNEQRWWPPVLLCNEMGILTGTYVDYYTEETVPLFGCYDFLLCNTQRHHSVFDWHPHCIYIPWGTEIEAFRPTSFAPKAPDRVVFFHSSGVSPLRKGTDLVIKAFASLSKDAQLIIHAQRPLSETLPELHALIEALIADGRLIVHEETVPTPGLYHLGDVYVYPSRLEGIGLTVAEALASGMPVITTDNPPMNEFVQPSVNGQLVAVEKLVARWDGYYWPQAFIHLDSLAEKMMYYVENYASLESYKTAAYAYASEHLDWYHNAEFLADYVGQIKKLPAAQLQQAARQAQAFEEARTPLRQRFPQAFYLLWIAARPIKWIRSRN